MRQSTMKQFLKPQKKRLFHPYFTAEGRSRMLKELQTIVINDEPAPALSDQRLPPPTCPTTSIDVDQEAEDSRSRPPPLDKATISSILEKLKRCCNQPPSLMLIPPQRMPPGQKFELKYTMADASESSSSSP